VNILVTGATGFLGRHLVRALKGSPGMNHIVATSRSANPNEWEHACGPEGAYGYVECPCDLTDAAGVRRLMKMVKPQVVYHLAANPIIKPDPDEPFRIAQDNILATHHLLEYCPEGTKFVFMSSASVYGDPRKRDQRFEEYDNILPTSVYGATKAAGESLVRAYTNLGRVSGTIVRGVANVGAWATHGLVRDLVRKAKSNDPRLELLGEPPGSVKPFVWAGDTAKALLLAGREQLPLTLNVAAEDELSVSDVARIVLDALGINKPMCWSGWSWKGDNPVVRVDSSAIKTILGWEPRFPKSADAVRHAVKEMEAMGC
jgi:UDP-glucose 4-epimerase